MDVETLRRLLDGDEEARRAVKEWLDRVSDDDLAGIGEDEGEQEPEASGDTFWAELRAAKTLIDSSPRDALPAVQKLSARARTSCEKAMTLGVTAYQRRLVADLREAGRLLSVAGELSHLCPVRVESVTACGLEINRRRSILELHQGNGADGLIRVEDVLEGYGLLGHCGHNLDGDGIAASLYARGVILGSMGNHRAALHDFSICLDRFSPGSAVWERVQGDFTTALSHLDDAGAQEKAWQLQHRRRYLMRSRVGSTEHAYFMWTDGQLAFKLGKQRWLRRMRAALEGFAGQGMVDEFLAVGHDAAAALFPHRDRMRAFFARDFLPLTRGLVRDPRHVAALKRVLDLLKGCPRPETTSLLAAAMNALRGALDPHLPPCLISIGPVIEHAG